MKNEILHYGFNGNETVLRELFVGYLLPVYCANSHLAERLPELTDQRMFEDLHVAVNSTVRDVNGHLERVNNLFELIGSSVNMNECNNMISMMEDAFSMIHKRTNDPLYRDLAILYYLQSISNIEETSYQMLDVVASKMNNLHLKLLIIENHQQAKIIKALPLLLQKKYFNLF
jgi:ferritin-like metal-binding protein YciE